MKDLNSIDYSILDHPQILSLLFYPRKEFGWQNSPLTYSELDIPTPDGNLLGSRFYFSSAHAPTILFFHGNGEIVEDYDDIAQIFLKIGINFFPVDYRGYGRSSGTPTVTAMMRDCHTIFWFVKKHLTQKNITGKLIIMGRSLGSASAIELASNYSEEIGGLIIESGFARLIPLLTLIGIDVCSFNITEAKCPNNMHKISTYRGPLLVIHAENDHIIPFEEGETLFSVCPSKEKEFLKIESAHHNNILQVGAHQYFSAIKSFLEKNLIK
ncbi:MAG: lysophospholipase [Spirochaetes bacterium]|nr:lysophospholipase [Spirochaetota bacterium]